MLNKGFNRFFYLMAILKVCVCGLQSVRSAKIAVAIFIKKGCSWNWV
jgi:hypothetical protein